MNFHKFENAICSNIHINMNGIERPYKTFQVIKPISNMKVGIEQRQSTEKSSAQKEFFSKGIKTRTLHR